MTDGKPQRYRHGWILINPLDKVAEGDKVLTKHKGSEVVGTVLSRDPGEHAPGQLGVTVATEHGVVRRKESALKVAASAAKPAKVKKPTKPKTRAEIHEIAQAKKWNREHKPRAENVVNIWKQANASEREDGMNWYKDANFTARAFASHTGVSVSQAAGIIAAYSPQTGWAENMMRAARVLRTKKAIGGPGAEFMATGDTRDRAQRILDGEDWRHVLTGQKISAFAALIENGEDLDPNHPLVVVDRHALSVASGARADKLAYAYSRLGGKKKYATVAQTFKDAADQISKAEGHPVSAHQVQAVTWLTQQRLNQDAEVKVSKSKRSSVASNAATAWAKWEKIAKADFPELLNETATTGYTQIPEDIAHEIALAYETFFGQDFDLAETVEPIEQQDPTQTATVTTPPAQDETAQHIVEILLAGYTLDKTAKAIAAIVPGISIEIWRAALVSTGGTKGHAAHARLNAHELRPDSPGAGVAKSAARREIVYRAAYIARAAARMQADVREGRSIAEAVRAEIPVYRSHEAARRGRLDAAARVGTAANMFGPMLGWYLNPLLNNEPECIAANGHNFYADESTIIGDPGAVHLNCGCTAGPPIPGAGMVNDAVAAAREVIFVQPKRYGLKEKAS
jgi:hypothetical protein